MKLSKGLEFHMVALPSVGHMAAKGESDQEAAGVFSMAATRVTQRLVGGDRGFANRLDMSQPARHQFKL